MSARLMMFPSGERVTPIAQLPTVRFFFEVERHSVGAKRSFWVGDDKARRAVAADGEAAGRVLVAEGDGGRPVQPLPPVVALGAHDRRGGRSAFVAHNGELGFHVRGRGSGRSGPGYMVG